MKKVLIVALGFLTFACGESGNTAGNSNNGTNIDESVEKGAGNEVSPQLQTEGDSATRLEVDTVSSSTEANQQKQ